MGAHAKIAAGRLVAAHLSYCLMLTDAVSVSAAISDRRPRRDAPARHCGLGWRHFPVAHASRACLSVGLSASRATATWLSAS